MIKVGTKIRASANTKPEGNTGSVFETTHLGLIGVVNSIVSRPFYDEYHVLFKMPETGMDYFAVVYSTDIGIEIVPSLKVSYGKYK